MRTVLQPARTAGLHLLRLTSPRRVIQGIEVVNLAHVGETEYFFRRVAHALEFIDVHDRRSLLRIRRDLKRIVLLRGGGEFYHQGLRAYVVDLPTLKAEATIQLARRLVHEATHARLFRRGIGYGSAYRARVESICAKAESAFLERVPTSLRGSALTDPGHPWWTDSSLVRRRALQLRTHGVPAWIVRLYERLRGNDE